MRHLVSLVLALTTYFFVSCLFATSTNVRPPASPIIMQPVTKPVNTAMIPSGVDTFVATLANECTNNETRDYCWKRYRATAGSTVPNNTLECPFSYYSIMSLGDSALDENNKPMYYVVPSYYPKVTKDQYDKLLALGYTCQKGSLKDANVEWGSGTSCALSCNGGEDQKNKADFKIMSDGYYGQYDPASVQQDGARDWYYAGPERCKKYTLSGCPGAWCCYGFKYGYVAKWIECKHDAGYQYAFSPADLADGLVTPALSHAYSPSTVICGKGKPSYEAKP